MLAAARRLEVLVNCILTLSSSLAAVSEPNCDETAPTPVTITAPQCNMRLQTFRNFPQLFGFCFLISAKISGVSRRAMMKARMNPAHRIFHPLLANKSEKCEYI